MLSTVDYLYPIVDDPYIQGKISCCTVLSNLYTLGVFDIDTILMEFTVSNLMSMEERDIICPELIRGFNGNLRY